MKKLMSFLVFIVAVITFQCQAQTALEISPSWANNGGVVQNITVTAVGVLIEHDNRGIHANVSPDVVTLILKLSAPETENEPAVDCTVIIPWSAIAVFPEARLAIDINGRGKHAGMAGSWRIFVHSSGSF